MLALRFYRGVTFVAAAFGAAVFSFALAAPARAESTVPSQWPITSAARVAPPTTPPLHATLKHPAGPGSSAAAAALLGPANTKSQSLTAGTVAPRLSPAVADPVVGVRGQLNIGHSHMYVPYYGNVAGGTNAEAESVAGLGYGFGSWNLSLVNRGLGTDISSMMQSMKSPNPSLSLSIRF